jgi:hypothetical protein
LEIAIMGPILHLIISDISKYNINHSEKKTGKLYVNSQSGIDEPKSAVPEESQKPGVKVLFGNPVILHPTECNFHPIILHPENFRK